MNKELLSNKEMQLLIFIYPIGSFSLFNMGAGVKQHAWIAVILGVVLSIPMLIMYGRIMELYPGNNIFQILEITFGKIFGAVFNVIFIFHAIFTGAYILHNVMDFIKVTALWNTPLFVSYSIIVFLIIWIQREGIEVICGWAKFNIRILLVLMCLTGILLIPQMNYTKLQPILGLNLSKVFKEGLSIAIYPFIETSIFLMFFDVIRYDNNTKNIFIKPVLLAGALATGIVVAYLMILGGNAYTRFYYPGFEAMKRMKFLGDFQRAEIIISIFFVTLRFLEINFCFLGACKGVEKVFKLSDYKNIIAPVVLFGATFAYIMFNSLMDAKEFVADLWTFYGVLVEVVFITFLFLIVFIKKKCEH